MTAVMTLPADPYFIAGTGSRELAARPNHWSTAAYLVINRLETALQHHPNAVAVSGMAEGFDELIARCAVYVSMPFIACIPSPDYGRYWWGTRSVLRTSRVHQFEQLREQAAEVRYIADRHLPYGAEMHQRNQHMVDIGHEFLVWNPTSRGTADCLRRIRAAGKPYEILTHLSS